MLKLSVRVIPLLLVMLYDSVNVQTAFNTV